MRSSELRKLIKEAISDAKGRDTVILDVRKVADFTDYMLIVSGTSNRHVLSVADRLVDKVRSRGRKPIGVEGTEIGDWVLVDFGDVVVHVMRQQARDFYNLEKLWGDGTKTKLKK